MTPGAWMARPASMLVIRACGQTLRTKLTSASPAMRMSPMNVPPPVTRRLSSSRDTSLPTYLVISFIAVIGGHRLGGAGYRGHDVLVSGAAAQVTPQGRAHLTGSRPRRFLQHSDP